MRRAWLRSRKSTRRARMGNLGIWSFSIGSSASEPRPEEAVLTFRFELRNRSVRSHGPPGAFREAHGIVSGGIELFPRPSSVRGEIASRGSRDKEHFALGEISRSGTVAGRRLRRCRPCLAAILRHREIALGLGSLRIIAARRDSMPRY